MHAALAGKMPPVTTAHLFAILYERGGAPPKFYDFVATADWPVQTCGDITDALGLRSDGVRTTLQVV